MGFAALLWSVLPALKVPSANQHANDTGYYGHGGAAAGVQGVGITEKKGKSRLSVWSKVARIVSVLHAAAGLVLTVVFAVKKGS